MTTAADAETPEFDGPGAVFVSHAREDRSRASPVIRALEDHGYALWWDGLTADGNVTAGSAEAALESAQAVVVLWSAAAVVSHRVRDEATRGRDRGRMVPISLDGSLPPLGFRQIHFIDLSKWRGKPGAPEFAEVLRAIDATVRAQGREQAETAVHRVPGPVLASRRRALLVGGGAVVAIGGGVAAWRAGLLGGKAPANAIAILPFRNLSGDPAQDYFSDGLAEELRTSLSLNRQLEVAAQRSSSSFKDGARDIRQIAAKLRVSHVLDGSVRRAGTTMRIAARLIDARSGFEEWSQSFDRSVEDVFAVQSEIATIVADSLAARLAGDAGQRRERLGGTKDTAAFDAYLRGMALYRLAANEASDRGALAQFGEAVRLDPGYAAAHAARARALTVIANNHASGAQLKATYQQAIDAAREAVRLAPDLAEGHSALGFALFNGRLDVQAAQAPYMTSFELGYGNADILSAFANFAARTGNFADARKAIARAQRLDPLNATVFRNAGVIEYAARDYNAAMMPLRTALSLNPEVTGVRSVLGDIQLIGGKPDAARSLYAQEPSGLARLRGLAIIDRAIIDRRPAASPGGEDHLARMVMDYGDNCLYQQAQVLAQTGKTDEALGALERALEVGDSGLVQSRNDPLLDPLRREARFDAIQRQLGFAAAQS